MSETDAALRRSVETLGYLREVQAVTEMHQMKATAPPTANREFREQSSWWLPREQLPKAWFAGPPTSSPAKNSNKSGVTRPRSPTNQSPSTPISAPRPRATASALRAHGVSDQDVASALSAAAAIAAGGGGTAGAQASAGSPGALRMTSRTNSSSSQRAPRQSAPGGPAPGGTSSPGPGGSGAGRGPGGAALVAALATVALQRQRRGASSSGMDFLPRGGPALYDGGGDAAVPGSGPVAPVPLPPGHPRLTFSVFQQAQAQALAQREQREEREEAEARGGELEEAEDEERSSAGSAAPGPARGTGYRALADEGPHGSYRSFVVGNGGASAAARALIGSIVARSGSSFALMPTPGGAARPAGSGSADPVPDPLSSPSPSPSPRVSQRGPFGAGSPGAHEPAAGPYPQQPPAPAPSPGADSLAARRAALMLPPSVRHSVAGGHSLARTSSPGALELGEFVDDAGPHSSASSLTGTGLMPTPPPPDGRPSGSSRLARSHRGMLHSGGQPEGPTSPRGSQPSSPLPGRPPASVRLFGQRSTAGGGEAAGAGSAAGDGGGGSAGAGALRARLRSLAVAPSGGASLLLDEGEGGRNGSSPGSPFARSMLAPASPVNLNSGPSSPSSSGGAALRAQLSSRALSLAGRTSSQQDTAVALPPPGPGAAAGEPPAPAPARPPQEQQSVAATSGRRDMSHTSHPGVASVDEGALAPPDVRTAPVSASGAITTGQQLSAPGAATTAAAAGPRARRYSSATPSGPAPGLVSPSLHSPALEVAGPPGHPSLPSLASPVLPTRQPIGQPRVGPGPGFSASSRGFGMAPAPLAEADEVTGAAHRSPSPGRAQRPPSPGRTRTRRASITSGLESVLEGMDPAPPRQQQQPQQPQQPQPNLQPRHLPAPGQQLPQPALAPAPPLQRPSSAALQRPSPPTPASPPGQLFTKRNNYSASTAADIMLSVLKSVTEVQPQRPLSAGRARRPSTASSPYDLPIGVRVTYGPGEVGGQPEGRPWEGSAPGSPPRGRRPSISGAAVARAVRRSNAGGGVGGEEVVVEVEEAAAEEGRPRGGTRMGVGPMPAFKRMGPVVNQTMDI